MKGKFNTTKSPIPLGAASALVWNDEGDITFLWTDEYQKDQTFCKNVSPVDVRRAMNNIPVDTGWLAPRVRRWGMSARGVFVVAYIPPQIHNLRLNNTWEGRFGTKRIIRLRCPLPGFVFAGRGTDYRVWALAEDFSPSAVVHCPPLPNTYGSGDICWGSNEPPACTPETILEAWKIFITSPFNDHLLGGQSRSQKDVREVLLALAEAEASAYPVKDLVPVNRLMTVDAVVQSYLTEGGAGLPAFDDDVDDEAELEMEEEEAEA